MVKINEVTMVYASSVINHKGTGCSLVGCGGAYTLGLDPLGPHLLIMIVNPELKKANLLVASLAEYCFIITHFCLNVLHGRSY